MWKTIRSYIPKKPANVKSFTKDDQTVANEFNRFLSAVGKSTMKKIQLLACKKIQLCARARSLNSEKLSILSQTSSLSPGWNVLRLKILLIQYLTRKPQELTKYHLA